MHYIHHYHFRIFDVPKTLLDYSEIKKSPLQDIEQIYCVFAHSSGAIVLEFAYRRPDIHIDTYLKLSKECAKDLERQMQEWLGINENWKILADPEFFKEFNLDSNKVKDQRLRWRSSVYGSGGIDVGQARLVRECGRLPENIWKCCQRKSV